MQFRIPFRVPADDRLVGSICEEALQTAEEGVLVATLHLPNESSDLERSLLSLYVSIKR